MISWSMTTRCMKLDLSTVIWYHDFVTITSFLHAGSSLPLVERLRNHENRRMIHTREHQIIVSRFFKAWSEWLMWCRIRVFDRWNVSFRFPIQIVCCVGAQKLVIFNVSSSSASTFGTKKHFLSSMITGFDKSFGSIYFHGSFGLNCLSGTWSCGLFDAFFLLKREQAGSFALCPHCLQQ